MRVLAWVLVSTVVVVSACATPTSRVDVSRLDEVKENRATVKRDGREYSLQTYIVPFQRPYYILVRETSNKALTVAEASTVAAEYIRPRGCTTPLSRRTDLDRTNADNTEWLIGIQC